MKRTFKFVAVALCACAVAFSSCSKSDNYSAKDIVNEYSQGNLSLKLNGVAVSGNGNVVLSEVDDQKVNVTLKNLIKGEPNYVLPAYVIASKSSVTYNFEGGRFEDEVSVSVNGSVKDGVMNINVNAQYLESYKIAKKQNMFGSTIHSAYLDIVANDAEGKAKVLNVKLNGENMGIDMKTESVMFLVDMFFGNGAAFGFDVAKYLDALNKFDFKAQGEIALQFTDPDTKEVGKYPEILTTKYQVPAELAKNAVLVRREGTDSEGVMHIKLNAEFLRLIMKDAIAETPQIGIIPDMMGNIELDKINLSPMGLNVNLKDIVISYKKNSDNTMSLFLAKGFFKTLLDIYKTDTVQGLLKAQGVEISAENKKMIDDAYAIIKDAEAFSIGLNLQDLTVANK